MSDKSFVILGFLAILAQAMANDKSFHPNEPPSELHKLQNLSINENHHNESNYGNGYIKNQLRIKRQTRDRYYPIPIIVGGIGYPAYGFPRGYGARSYGGRGIPGRGYGVRGFGGRGFGGRGFGGRGFGGRGIGGRGGIGGGRGGRG